jgi:hypothetical protein
VDGWEPQELVRRCAQAGLLCLTEGRRLRMVTHRHIGRAEVEEAVERLRRVLAAHA